MIVDINKQYQTRDGEKVRIYCTDGGGEYPVHGAIWNKDPAEWLIMWWTSEGKLSSDTEDDFDLVEVKPRIYREYWLNLYNNSRVTAWRNRQSADEAAKEVGNNRIACVKIVIDCEEGEGL